MPNWTGRRLSSYLRTIVQTFFIEVRLLILDTKDCQDLRLVDFIVRLVLARMIRRFSILAEVEYVFTFRVAFLLLRMEFMHSSFSQTVWAIAFAMSGKSETSTLFTFKC